MKNILLLCFLALMASCAINPNAGTSIAINLGGSGDHSSGGIKHTIGLGGNAKGKTKTEGYVELSTEL